MGEGSPADLSVSAGLFSWKKSLTPDASSLRKPSSSRPHVSPHTRGWGSGLRVARRRASTWEHPRADARLLSRGGGNAARRRPAIAR